MSLKANVRRLPVISSFHIPVSHRRFQNRAAAVYDMTIDCHDIETICHIHRLSQSVVLQDLNGNLEYLQSRLNLTNRNDIKKRFLKIIKEIQEDNIQPTLAAIAHHIPFVYIQQALADEDITDAMNRFLNDFNPKKMVEIAAAVPENPIQQQLLLGQPVLTHFEKHLLVEHLVECISQDKIRCLHDMKKYLLAYVQDITTINYSSDIKISQLDRVWLKNFLLSAESQMKSLKISWLRLDRL
uniref:Uncharacterized protein n=1 Tax=Philodina roseola TaxID=96448 RepID=B6S380_PHIRO|nr:hypothetical protein [Philodina roseola]